MKLPKKIKKEVLDIFLSIPERIIVDNEEYIFYFCKLNGKYLLRYISCTDGTTFKSWRSDDFVELLTMCYSWLAIMEKQTSIRYRV